MILEGVKLGDIDQSISETGGRRLNIRVSSSSSFSTPVRPITTVEISAKSFLGYKGLISAPIAALPMSIEGKKYKEFLMDNGTVNELKKELEMLSIATSPLVKFPIFQTPAISTNDRVPLKISFEIQSTMHSLDYISIPNLICNPETYEKVVQDWCEKAMDIHEKGCVPQLSMDEDPSIFSLKLDALSVLSKMGLISVVNIIYSDPTTHPVHYARLWHKRGDLEFLINCSEVPVKGSEIIPGLNYDLENTLIRHGIDSISRKKRRLSKEVVAALRGKSPPTSLNDVTKFNWAVHDATATVHTKHWVKVHDSEPCGCSVCRGRNTEHLTDQFAYTDNGDIERMGLRYMATLHDHQSDQVELSEVGKAIRENSMCDYQQKAVEKRKVISNRIMS